HAWAVPRGKPDGLVRCLPCALDRGFPAIPRGKRPILRVSQNAAGWVGHPAQMGSACRSRSRSRVIASPDVPPSHLVTSVGQDRGASLDTCRTCPDSAVSPPPSTAPISPCSAPGTWPVLLGGRAGPCATGSSLGSCHRPRSSLALTFQG